MRVPGRRRLEGAAAATKGRRRLNPSPDLEERATGRRPREREGNGEKESAAVREKKKDKAARLGIDPWPLTAIAAAEHGYAGREPRGEKK